MTINYLLHFLFLLHMFSRQTAIGMMRQAKTGADLIKVADLILNEYNMKQDQLVQEQDQEQVEYEAMGEMVRINNIQHDVDVETNDEGYVKVIDFNGNE